MGFVDLFFAASVSILKVLIVTALGSFLALDSIDLLGQSTRKQVNNVISAKVIRNKQTGQSEGYGFIEFANRGAAERHLQTYNGSLMPNVEQNFRLNWASFGVGEKRADGSPDFTILLADINRILKCLGKRGNYSLQGNLMLKDH